MRISVGIPVYDGKVSVSLAHCLLTETSLALAMGDSITFRFLSSCTNLALGRNQLVKEFLASNDERLVFVDADVTFEPGALLKIAHYPVDFVGGAYRFKEDVEKYPIKLLSAPSDLGPMGLVEVAMVPTGFLALSRKVFEQFKAGYPDREYTMGAHKTHCYFQIPYCDGALFTEDAYFCKEWKAIGGQIYLDPELALTHWEFSKPYSGHIGNWMRRRVVALPTI